MIELIKPDWPAPQNVMACTTTRTGGNSPRPYASLNLAEHVGDAPAKVAANRELVQQQLGLPAEPFWLQQEHTALVVEAGSPLRLADASWSTQVGQVCAVLTADCLPVLMCNSEGSRIAACHAGWRGLHAGVIEHTLGCFTDVERTLVWLGPAIGAQAFEVGGEVRDAFIEKQAVHANAFQQVDAAHWLCDIYQLARNVLQACGVRQIFGGELCSYTDSARFYSFRRDGITGRMASLIWMQ